MKNLAHLDDRLSGIMYRLALRGDPDPDPTDLPGGGGKVDPEPVGLTDPEPPDPKVDPKKGKADPPDPKKSEAAARKKFLAELGCDTEEEYKALVTARKAERDKKKASDLEDPDTARRALRDAEEKAVDSANTLEFERFSHKVELAGLKAGLDDEDLAFSLYNRYLGRMKADGSDPVSPTEYFEDLKTKKPEMFGGSSKTNTGPKGKDPDPAPPKKGPSVKRVQDMTPTERAVHYARIRRGG